jgi:hypothetical protein
VRQYKDPAFSMKVAEHALDLLDIGMFHAGRGITPPLPGNNLERANLARAGASTARQAREILDAMHAVDRAWLDVCKVVLPSHLPPGYAERLKEARWELFDICEELGELWEAKATAIWSTLPVESRARRLRQMADDIGNLSEGTEEREIRTGHLNFRIGLDPDAARMAGFDPGYQGMRTTAARA